jgi:nicotinamidase-related amidase
MTSTLEIDPRTTALVIIDLQKGIVSMPTEPHDTRSVIANAVRLSRAFRQREMPVFLVHVLRSRDTALRPIADGPVPSLDPLPADWSEIVPELGPEPSDVVIPKRQWGAFYGTELEMRLRRGGIDTIVLAGIATTYGVQSTARIAYEHGYQQIFVEDAMSDRSRDSHRASIEFVLKRIGRVRTTEEVLGALA